jgi:hypothetical protein
MVTDMVPRLSTPVVSASAMARDIVRRADLSQPSKTTMII